MIDVTDYDSLVKLIRGSKPIRGEERLIAEGRSPIYEGGLDNLPRKVISDDHLKTTGDLREAIITSEMTFICVGTPQRQDDSVGLLQVENATREVDKSLEE